MQLRNSNILIFILLILFFLPFDSEGYNVVYRDRIRRVEPKPITTDRRVHQQKRLHTKPPKRTNGFQVIGIGLLILGGLVFLGVLVGAIISAASSGLFFGPIVTPFVIFFLISGYGFIISLLFLLPGILFFLLGQKFNERRDGVFKNRKKRKPSKKREEVKNEQPQITARQYESQKEQIKNYRNMGMGFLGGGALLTIAYLIGTTSIVLILGVVGLLLGTILLVSAGLQATELKKKEIRK